MIHPAALPAVPGLLPLGEVLSAQAADGLEGADFGALLAIEAGETATPGLATKLPEPPAAVVAAILPEAAVLPQGGKDLPVALPVEGSGNASAFAPRISPAAAANTVITDGPPPPVDAPQQPAASPVAAIAPAKPESGAAEAPVAVLLEPQATAPGVLMPASAVTAQVAVVEAPGLPLPRAVAIALSLPANQPREPAQVATPPNAAASQSPPAPITLSVMTVAVVPAAPSTGLRLRRSLPTVSTAAPAIAEPQPSLILTKPDAAQALKGPAPAAAEPRLLPAAVTAERARLVEKMVLAQPVAEPVVLATSTAPAAQAHSALQAFTPTDPALRPHDFTQLVDRLVAARELVQPQSFQLAVQHGEFGQVQLRFRQEGEGLTIIMASADPEFARVVNAAPAPVLPALPVETSAPGGQRSDSQSQSATNNGHSAQQRGALPERREDRNGPADNPSAVRQSEERGSRRSGIFA